MAPPSELPSNANLRQLKNQAKELLKAHRTGAPEVIERLRQSLSEWTSLSDEQGARTPLSLRDAQRAIAREYSFATWSDLRHHLEATRGAPARQSGDLERYERHLREARELLA